MALAQRIEQFEAATPRAFAYVDDPLPPLIRREIDELNAREAALPVRSSAKARRLIVCSIVGGATSWGVMIGIGTLVSHLIA